MMRFAVAGLVLLCAACGGPSRLEETPPHRWDLPSFKNVEHQVHGPMPFEETKDHIDRMLGKGWDLVSYESAAPDFPSKYLLTFRRPILE